MELVGECGYANSGREGVQGDRSRGRARPGRAGAHRSSSSSFSSSALFGSDVIFLTTGLLSFLGGSNDVPIYRQRTTAGMASLVPRTCACRSALIAERMPKVDAPLPHHSPTLCRLTRSVSGMRRSNACHRCQAEGRAGRASGEIDHRSIRSA